MLCLTTQVVWSMSYIHYSFQDQASGQSEKCCRLSSPNPLFFPASSLFLCVEKPPHINNTITTTCRHFKIVLVSWYFEPSQPQQITSGLKQNQICLLFTLHTSHQTTNSQKNTKSIPTQIYIKQNIHKHQTQIFWRISPFGIAPIKKAHKARTHLYHGPFRRFINTRFLRSIKKRNGHKQ